MVGRGQARRWRQGGGFMLLGRDAKVGLVDARVGATAVNGAVVTSSGDSHPSATRTAKRIGLVAARYPHSPFVPVPTRQGCQRQRSVSWSRSSRFAVSSRRPFGEPAAFHCVDWTYTLWRGGGVLLWNNLGFGVGQPRSPLSRSPSLCLPLPQTGPMLATRPEGTSGSCTSPW